MIFVNRKTVLDYLSKNDSLVFDSIEDFVYGKERVPYFRIENRSEFPSPEEKDELALSDTLVLQKMAKDWSKKNMKKRKRKRFPTPFD